jgi:hypothetical protein
VDLYEKIAQAYQDEMERLFQLAEAKGIVDPDLTREKRAAYREFEKVAGREVLILMDELALEAMKPIEKLALFGGLSKLSGMFGGLISRIAPKAEGLAARMFSRAPSAFEGLGQGVAHSSKAMSMFGGAGGEAAQSMLSGQAKAGPVVWGKMRRMMGRPSVGPAAPPTAAGKPNSLVGDLKSGLGFGLAMGAGQRLLAPDDKGKVQIGY